MKRTAFDERRDQRVVEDFGADRALMCAAHGCPNRWSVDPPRMCSAHAWADPNHWPSITQEQLDAETQRAIDAASPTPTQRYITPDPVKLRRYLTKLAQAVRDSSMTPREWAQRLQEREAAGERLTIAQRKACRFSRDLPETSEVEE